MPLDKETIVDAVKQAKEKSEKRNFTQSVELVLTLRDIDMKSPEGKIQQIVELPNALEKTNKICVIATGDMALKAKKAKADLVVERSQLEGWAGKKKELRKIAGEYDFFLAEAPSMPLVGRILGPVLGPRGKLPVPVPPNADIEGFIEKHRKAVVVKMRNQPILQCRVGTEGMKEEEIAENVQTIVRAIEGKLKKGVKNIKFAYIKTSMGTPIKIKP